MFAGDIELPAPYVGEKVRFIIVIQLELYQYSPNVGSPKNEDH